MSLTPVTITGTFSRPDGSAGFGTVTATLSASIQNGTDVIDPTPIAGVVVNGALLAQSYGPFVLTATDDTGTDPAGAHYTFVIELDSAPLRAFNAAVPHSPTTVDLSALEPVSL